MTAIRGSAAIANTSAASSSLVLPAGILGGDLILLFFDQNNITATLSAEPAGYAKLNGAATQSTSMQSTCYSKTAAGVQGAASTDAGATVTVSWSAGTPSSNFHAVVLSLGSASNPTILANAVVSDVGGLATHATPSRTFSGNNKCVIEHVSDKAAAPGTAWTVPAGFTKVKDAYSVAASGCTSVTAINNADTATSPAGGDVYTETVVAPQAISWTIVITPATNGVFGGGGAAIDDAKRALLVATNTSLGLLAIGSVADLEFAFYSNQSGLGTGAKNSIRDHKKAFYILKGFTGDFMPSEIVFMQSKGALGTSYSSIRLDFYQNRSLV